MNTQPAVENGFASAGGEWAPIAGESVRRVGVVDVGSNSVRLVVFDGVARSPAYFYNEKILCGLGRGLRESGILNPDGRARAMAAIRRFAALARVMEVTALTGVATAAVREADDGETFCRAVAAETGLSLNVAAGEEEALLSAKGVLLGWPQATGLVCDIGGASMELARVERGVVGACATSALGPLALADVAGKALDKRIAVETRRIVAAIGGAAPKIYLVGGSWRAIARLDMERRGYPLKVLHEYGMTPKAALETCDWLADSAPEDLRALTDTSTARLDLVPTAARVLRHLLAEAKPHKLVVSSYGLREGLLYEKMPPSLRARDPLLEAARHMEQTRARFPGFGASLYTWLSPLYRDTDRARLRLIRAACYLHDIAWRAHPDYRAEVCFETVTRANLSGLDHAGRVFLGAAIQHRYKNRAPLEGGVYDLLNDEERMAAEILGNGLRLGAMLSGAAPGSLENTELGLDRDTLRLTLRGPARDLRGEAVDRRLAALAGRLGLESAVTLSAA